MDTPGLIKNFIFNEKIDSQCLFDLYADDLLYMQEVFAITLQHFDHDYTSIEKAWAGGNLTELKRAVHKLKPAFGFVGLPGIQQLCQAFESACQHAVSNAELKESYQELVTTLAAGKHLMQSAYEQLKAHNSNPL